MGSRAGNRQKGAFRQFQDFFRGVFSRMSGKAVSSRLSPEALDKSRFQEDGDNLFQITYGNVLPGGNLLQGNVAFVAVMGEIDHQAQRVTSSGGNLHHIG